MQVDQQNNFYDVVGGFQCPLSIYNNPDTNEPVVKDVRYEYLETLDVGLENRSGPLTHLPRLLLVNWMNT